MDIMVNTILFPLLIECMILYVLVLVRATVNISFSYLESMLYGYIVNGCPCEIKILKIVLRKMFVLFYYSILRIF